MNCQNSTTSLFELMDNRDIGINFINTIHDDTSMNIIEYLYFYNGGGVAVGDINNDGLIDIYFSSNRQANRLFLNKGDWKFEDITTKAGVEGIGNWSTGVTMADVNGDGWLDIYLCGVGNYKGLNSKNQLFINDGDMTFTDRIEEYGLSFEGFSTQAVFFDYDLDGDLDCYLLNHAVHSSDAYVNISARNKSDTLSGDLLFRNELINSSGTQSDIHFVDVTKMSGILSSRLGYGLGISVSDLNMDGYPDIYVSNDFQENDYLYLNNKKGGFNQVLEESMPHSSRFSMGNDASDVNNDGFPDIITLDMLPKDESIIKRTAGEDTYEIHQYKLKYGYHRQVMRNCLQLNVMANDSVVKYTDIALMSGISATDWSWNPMLVDLDNDGLKDVFITTGIVRRPNDMDYISYISNVEIQRKLDKIDQLDLQLLEKMPKGDVPNAAFKNQGNFAFSDSSNKWGIGANPSLSNGGAYADLDNDGDFDLIINNINQQAFIYQNHTDKENSHYVRLSLKGRQPNTFGIGTKAIAHVKGSNRFYEVLPSRGFMSHSDHRIIIGMGSEKKLDSLTVIWSSGMAQRFYHINADTTFTAVESDAEFRYINKSGRVKDNIFSPVHTVPQFVHAEDDFSAIRIESLLPHELTHEGPPMVSADVNNDGLEDVFVGGGIGQQGQLFLQAASGEWIPKTNDDFQILMNSESVAACFIDANADGYMDLVVASGGQMMPSFSSQLTPQLFMNDGKGNFQHSRGAFGSLAINASCLESCDYDADGDTDLFCGGSVLPGLYGVSPPSYLLQNDGNNHFIPVKNWLGNSEFSQVPKNRIGMVKDASWTDVNGDLRPDLVVVGEWMPITILEQNEAHEFINKTDQYGLQNTKGWWNTIVSSDFDQDSQEEFIIGNLGLNARIKASLEQPVKLYVGDFDSNNSSDHVLVYYNQGRPYPFVSLEHLTAQLPSLKKKYLYYKDYSNVVLEDIVTPQQLGNAIQLDAYVFESIYLYKINDKFEWKSLPSDAQLAPIKAIVVSDINSDGYDDIVVAGNLLPVSPELGSYDSSIGCLLLGDGSGNWQSISTRESGLLLTGEVRAMTSIKSLTQGRIILVARNNDTILGYSY